MIIKRIQANSLLKYAQLDLALPERGLIAISGPNESGKSSIGEAVCFALFGRTFSIGPDDLHKVVRWGENHCSAILDFSVAGQDYRLSRFLDRDGNHSARLSRLDEEEPMARGTVQVADAMAGLLGFEYEQFVESFYLAQREITTPHPHSQAVKIMAGIAPLERVAHEFDHEIDERNELLEEVRTECETVEHELQLLALDEGLLGKLETDRLEAIDKADQTRVIAEEMAERLEVYSGNAEQIHRAESARGRASFFRFVFFVLALLSGATWWLLTQGAQMALAGQLRGLLDHYIPQYQQVPPMWFAYAAAALFVLFLLLWARAGSRNRVIRELRQESARLADTLSAAREIDVTFSEPVATADAAAEDQPAEHLDGAGEEVEDLETDAMPTRPSMDELEAIRAAIGAGEATVRKVRAYTEREIAWLTYAGELLRTEVSQLDDAIADEKARRHEVEGLHEVLAGMQEKRDDVIERIALRRLALELLDRAIAHLSNTFNRDIKDLVGRMLPLFTDGRYEHLQIDRDLKVRVFSSEKRDFMDLEEVSSGTQRQIMLALRLALSQKLLSRTIKDTQFAFLDEPFAFFDEERTRNALGALSSLGDDISQVWIVAQTFPDHAEVEFSANLVCQRGQSELKFEA